MINCHSTDDLVCRSNKLQHLQRLVWDIKTRSELKATICELKLPRRKCYVGLREATVILSKSLDDKSTNLMMVLEV